MTKGDTNVLDAMRVTLANVDLNRDNGIHIATIAQCMIHEDQRLGRIEGDVSTLKSDVSTLKSDVAVLKSDVKDLKTEMTSVHRKIDLLTDDVREVLSHNMVLIDALKRGEGLK